MELLFIHRNRRRLKCHCLFLLVVVFSVCAKKCSGNLLPSFGGEKNIVLRRIHSPYNAVGDTIIPFGTTVLIENGTVIRFPPGSQLIVRGTLIAQGTSNHRILFTSSSGNIYTDQQQTPSGIKFRLIDGASTQNGLLQIYHKDHWRYVCSQSYRWFDFDANLTCRTLGFRNGTVSPHRNNYQSMYGIVIDYPACTSSETNLLNCAGFHSPQIGLHICDDKQYIHLICDGFYDPSPFHNWGGIVFERRRSIERSIIPEISDSATTLSDQPLSQSILSYVDIFHAGFRPSNTIRAYPERYAALTVFDHSPLLYNVTVQHSASDGMNFSNVMSSVLIENSLSTRNQGHGIVVTTRYGNVTLNNVDLKNNGGDGILYMLNNTEWSKREQEEDTSLLYKSFCETANIVQYPSYLRYRPLASGTCCSQKFVSRNYYTRITIHFQTVLIHDQASNYRFELYNGAFDYAPLISNITFLQHNHTLESISSDSNEILVRFCHYCNPFLGSCSNVAQDKIMLYAVYDYGRDADLHLWNTRIMNNSNNGVRVVNLRSLVELNQTLISGNNRHGLEIDSGAGSIWSYHSKFNWNGEDGVHIEYNGGERRFLYSEFSHNFQHGVYIKLERSINTLLSNITHPSIDSYRQITNMNGSIVRSNMYYGLYHGATCRLSYFQINGTLFERCVYDAIRLETCQHEWRPSVVISNQFRAPSYSNFDVNTPLPPIYSSPYDAYPKYPPFIPVALLFANETGNIQFNVTWNRFLNNKRLALRIDPVQNIIGDICNNSVIGHENGGIHLIGNNSNWIKDVYLRNVTLRIMLNNFTDNRGHSSIVSLGLNELSPYQTILFIYNRLMNNNITDHYNPFLNSRSKTSGVLAISSSHIRVTRNIFGNNFSRFDIVSQLTNSNVIIQADMNFFTNIYPPSMIHLQVPLTSNELQQRRQQQFQTAIQKHNRLSQQQHQPSPSHRYPSSLDQFFLKHNNLLDSNDDNTSVLFEALKHTRYNRQIQTQPLSQISYSYLPEPFDLKTNFFPYDPLSPLQQQQQQQQIPVQYLLPQNQILSIPSVNKSQLLSSQTYDAYYASPASTTYYYYSLYYEKPELCFQNWPKIRSRIFDYHNRSNLAQIIWYPFLCSDRNLTTEIWQCQLPNCGFSPASFYVQQDQTQRENNFNYIGGVLDKFYILSPGKYIVNNDILIKPGAGLTIENSQLQFMNGIGMFVMGELIVKGHDGSKTRFELFENETSNSILINQQIRENVLKNRYSNSSEQGIVMLIAGPSIYEGRLFVVAPHKSGSGTICNKNWKQINSIIICNQLGFIHDPNEHVYSNNNRTIMLLDQTVSTITDPILWSEIDCDYLDQTIFDCRREIAHTCDHSEDVWIKCLPPSWAGVHIAPSYSKCSLEYVHFDSAGQYDYHLDEIHSALEIDLNNAQNYLTNLTFSRNIIGLEMHIIHPYSKSYLYYSNFIQNSYVGLYLHTDFLNITHCNFSHHVYSSVHIESTFSYYTLEQYRLNIQQQRNIDVIDLLTVQSYYLERNKYVFLTTTFGGYNSFDNVLKNILTIQTDPSFILVFELIDYNPLSNTDEQLFICEYVCIKQLKNNYKKWSLANDRDQFPIITAYANVQLHYQVNYYRSGRLTLVVYSVQAPTFQDDINGWTNQPSDSLITFHKCLFVHNQHDIVNYLNDREPTNQFYQKKLIKSDIERLFDQLLNENVQNRIEQREQNIFLQEEQMRKQIRPATTVIQLKRRYKNSTLYIVDCLFKNSQNCSILIQHESIWRTPDKIEQDIRLLMNHTLQQQQQQRKPFIPIQYTCRIDYSIFYSNAKALTIDAHPLIYSDRLLRLEISHTNFTKNYGPLINITLPRLFNFNRTFFASLSTWPYLSSTSIYTRAPSIYSLMSHGIRLYRNRYLFNENFLIKLAGYHSSVNITRSLFEANIAQDKLIEYNDIEKDTIIQDNTFTKNRANSLLYIDSTGHAPFHNDLLSISMIVYNTFFDNGPIHLKSPFVTSCLHLSGSKNATIQRNIFENINYEYEFIAGLLIDSLNTTIDITLNWWGSDVYQAIQNRILDFTERADHSLTVWNPFLACREPTCASIKLPIDKTNGIFHTNRPIRGIIYASTILHKRKQPYLINGDIIILPGVTLTLSPGVQLHFAPNTGILVLGQLNAVGTAKEPIVMRLANKTFIFQQIMNGDNPYRYHFVDDTLKIPYHLKQNTRFDRLQLRLAMGRSPNEGFVQIYNRTTRDWSYVCYDTFKSKQSFRLICYQLNLPWRNVFAYSEKFYLYDNQQLPIWHETVDCSGSELTLSSCSYDTLFNYKSNDTSCQQRLFYIGCYETNDNYEQNTQQFMINDYTYLNFGIPSPYSLPTYDNPQAWSGIQFANSEYEEDLSNFDYTSPEPSVLNYVLLSEGGYRYDGLTHNCEQPVIQTIYRTPAIERSHIQNSRSHGYEFILPKRSLLFGFSRITNSLNKAINGVVYHGQSTSTDSDFDLLYEQTLTSCSKTKPFSLLHMCNAHRIVNIKYRLVTYFNYDHQYRTCSKLFCTKSPSYQIALRFIQGNLVNSSYQNDWIEIHRVTTDSNGYEINELKAYLTNGSNDQWAKPYSIKTGCLRLTIHASNGRPTNGFMAEIMTLPVSPFSTKEIIHKISDNTFIGNQHGVLNYLSAGERSADFYFQRNTIMSNGFYRYNSSSLSINQFLFQNAQRFYFGNNWLSRNLGGTYVQCHSHSSSSIFNGYIFNNVFYDNRNDSVLAVHGVQLSAYCNLYTLRNALIYNDAYDRNLVSFETVVANFSRNQVYNNTATNIISMFGFDKIAAPYPSIEMNTFKRNKAVGELNQPFLDRMGAIVVASNPRQLYMFNTFENLDSRYEMLTKPKSSDDILTTSQVNASMNYWGKMNVKDIDARIHDKYDNKLLLEVNYFPPYLDPGTLRQGKCEPGWSLNENLCYFYFGSVTTYQMADELCQFMNGRLARRGVQGRLSVLRALWKSSQYDFNNEAPATGVWLGKEMMVKNNIVCNTFDDMQVNDVSCTSSAAFICEKEQLFESARFLIRGELLIAAVCLFGLLILTLPCICCWYCKSKQRKKDSFNRQNSLRRSIKHEISKESLNGIASLPSSTLTKSGTLSTMTTSTITANSSTKQKLLLNSSTITASDNSGSRLLNRLSSLTDSSDQEINPKVLSNSQMHDFSLLRLRNHQQQYSPSKSPGTSTPAMSETNYDTSSQRGLIDHSSEKSLYSPLHSPRNVSASLNRSSHRYTPINKNLTLTPPSLPPAPPVVNRRSKKREIETKNDYIQPLDEQRTRSSATSLATPDDYYYSQHSSTTPTSTISQGSKPSLLNNDNTLINRQPMLMSFVQRHRINYFLPPQTQTQSTQMYETIQTTNDEAKPPPLETHI